MQKVTIESIFKNSKEIAIDIAVNIRPYPQIAKLSLIIMVCGGVYGATMGISHSWLQVISSFVKVPLLYLLTLVVSLPTLHFIGLFLGSKISFLQSMSVLLLGIAINAVLLLGFSTISLFFFATGSGYKFLLFMHVLFFIISGAAGLIAINRTFNHIAEHAEPEKKRGNLGLLRVWMLLYMFVGTQMAFILSPFVGKDPNFFWFHHPKSNFYTYLFDVMFEKFDGFLPPEKAKEMANESAEFAIYALKNKDMESLSKMIDSNKGMVIYVDAKKDQDSYRDVRFSSVSFLDASNKNDKITIYTKYDSKKGAFVEKSMKFDELYGKFLYDKDYAAVLKSAKYNTFTRGVSSRDYFRRIFPDHIFVEFTVEEGGGNWSVLRLVFKNPDSREAKGYLPLSGMIHYASPELP